MTEAPPGAGSDPCRICGHKWFITGADGAGFFIIFARTSGDPGQRGGAKMFLAPADAPGLRVGRHIATPDKAMIGGHCEVFFDELLVPDSAVLGGVDRGFEYAQARLGPARMTHIMRWLGAARRGHDVDVARVAPARGSGPESVTWG
jgi:alkylation response protein AidB-like acyl-CoA dehydrogenase